MGDLDVGVLVLIFPKSNISIKPEISKQQIKTISKFLIFNFFCDNKSTTNMEYNEANEEFAIH